jgi:hypothetical protein
LEFDPDGAVGGYNWTEALSWNISRGTQRYWYMDSTNHFSIGLFAVSGEEWQINPEDGVGFDNLIAQTAGQELPPVHLELVPSSTNNLTSLAINWREGIGPYQLQKNSVLHSNGWQNVGSPVFEMSTNVFGNFTNAFFRVQDLGQ